MARKSTVIEPDKEKPIEQKKAETVNGGKVLVAFDGSWTWQGTRYTGVHEWDANDPRLWHATGCYKIVGRK